MILVVFLSALFSFGLKAKEESVNSFVNNEADIQKKYLLPGGHDISEKAIKMRKHFVLSQIASDAIKRNVLLTALKRNAEQLNGKHLIPQASAELKINPDNKDAKAVILAAMRYRQRDNMFTKIRAAQAFNHFHDLFNQNEVLFFKQEMSTYPGFFGYGTENHIVMKRIAGLLFGQSFPDVKFRHALTGEQVNTECRSYMQRYGRAVYGSSNSEFLSHIYFPVHMEAWAIAWQYARDPITRLMAKAMLDWFFANAAINFHNHFINGPLHRGSYGGIEKYRKNALSRLLWVYGADTGELFEELSTARMPGPVVSIALTDYIPHESIRNILTKRVKLPFSIHQASANKAHLEKSYQNAFIAEKYPKKYPYQKSLFRTVYMGENYAMGGGNLRIAHEIFSSQPTTIAFTASWQSEHPYNYLVAVHPYWFTKKIWGGKTKKWGFGKNIYDKSKIEGNYFMDEDLFGFSPCFQMVQKENAAVLFYYIPKIDPFKDYHQKGGSASDRLKELIQECFIYIPKSVAKLEKKGHGFFINDGNTYIAVLPFSPEASLKESVRKDFIRIGIPGELTGFAIEMGDANEYTSFEQFKSQFKKKRLDLSHLKTERKVQYNSTRGHVLNIKHTGFNTGLPESSINNMDVDFDSFPTIESPYVSSKDHVLDVNDGKSGFQVDWHKEYPSYTYYRFEQEKKIRYKRVWVENDKVKNQTILNTN